MKRIFIIIPIVSLFMLVFTPVLILFFIPPIIAGSLENDTQDVNNNIVMCSVERELDLDVWNKQMSKAGILSDYGDSFLYYADLYDIDPVLFVAIAMHETGWGTSNAVKNYNNPGGLMDPSTNSKKLYKYPTLDDGIKAMAKTLNKWINQEGKTTISDLGSIYAPVGAENDPNNINVHWVPRVTEYVNDFGGLIKNCEPLDQIEFVGEKAWIVPHTKIITSHFRTPSRPNHNGIDIASSGIRGTPVVAFMDGVVTISSSHGTTFESDFNDVRNGRSYGYGYYVEIDHGNGLKTRYAHLLKEGIPAGTEVRAGQVIGYVGSTGKSTGPHLHFEVIVDDKFVDPLIVLEEFIRDK